MNNLFAAWLDSSQRWWIIFLALCIVIASFPLGISGMAVFLWLVTGSQTLACIGGALVLVVLWGSLGGMMGFRIADSFCIGMCGAIHFLAFVFVVPTLGQIGALVAFLLPQVGIIWILGHHPPIPSENQPRQ